MTKVSNGRDEGLHISPIRTHTHTQTERERERGSPRMLGIPQKVRPTHTSLPYAHTHTHTHTNRERQSAGVLECWGSHKKCGPFETFVSSFHSRPSSRIESIQLFPQKSQAFWRERALAGKSLFCGKRPSSRIESIQYETKVFFHKRVCLFFFDLGVSDCLCAYISTLVPA